MEKTFRQHGLGHAGGRLLLWHYICTRSCSYSLMYSWWWVR